MPTKTLEFQTFTAPDGNPTCAVGIDSNNRCFFLNYVQYGFVPVCEFRGIKYLDKRNIDGFELGYLMPHKHCPMWKDEK